MARVAVIRFTSTFASSLAILLSQTGCARYADFTLPELTGNPKQLYLHIQPKPVLERGAPGAWDSSDVLNPSVVQRSGQLFNFYSGFDGHTWHTGLAISAEGELWDKHPGPVLSPDPNTWESGNIAANGSALSVGDEFWYWYQTGKREAPQIAFARSKDGITWTKNAGPVLPYGPRGSFDEVATADPYVLRVASHFYMYYLGQDRAHRQRLGLARSEDGVVWQKSRGNPLFDLPAPGSRAFDENGQGEPAVFVYHNLYWLLWTGRDSSERRAIGLAQSNDGVRWTQTGQVFRGDQPWDKAVLADPAVLILNGQPALWFGGGNQPSPDEHLNGQIGFGKIE